MNSVAPSEEHKAVSRLVLGTAQLGMPYGIANSTGQPDFETAGLIVKTAWEAGIREFDTAQAYGESETILGRVLASLGIANKVRIITKLHPNLEPRQERDVHRAVKKSLQRLQISSLYGLMLHREEWLDHLNNGLEKTLRALALDGTVQHLGVSLYKPAKALQALQSDIFDMIQVPANILDRRFAEAGVFNLASKKGKQVYIRSVFLQGLLLMKPEDLPAKMALAKPTLTKLDSLCQQYKLTPNRLVLLYIKQEYTHAKVVFGAEMPEQIDQNVEDVKGDLPAGLMNEIKSIFSDAGEDLVDPSKWPKQ
jgi:aryl-alcohol dehydrogenase-like predicted oxidoreductase